MNDSITLSVLLIMLTSRVKYLHESFSGGTVHGHRPLGVQHIPLISVSFSRQWRHGEENCCETEAP